MRKSPRASPLNELVFKISPICSLLGIVIAENLLFTNFIYMCSVIALQLFD